MVPIPVWSRALAGAICIAGLATACGVVLGSALLPLDSRLYDIGLLARPTRSPPKIVILGIDEQFMAGRHAYLAPRDRLAKLMEVAASGRPAAIAVDVWLDSRMDEGENGVDARLRAALLGARQLHVPVYLSDIPAASERRLGGQSARGQTLDFFKSASAGAASVVFDADPDGAVRGLPAPGPLPFLPAVMADAGDRVITGHQDGQIFTRARLPLDYCGGPGAIPITPAMSFVNQPLLAPLLNGKLVFIGAAYPRSADFVESPYSLRTPARPFYGVEVLAQATNSLLQTPARPLMVEIPRQPFGDARGRLIDGWLCFALTLLAALLAWRGALYSGGFAAACVLGAAWGAVASAAVTDLHARGGLGQTLWDHRYHPASLFCIALPLGSALAIGWRQTQQARELKMVRDAFGAYVGDEVLAELGGRLPELGGEVRPIAVLFCDIRGYSALAESMQNDPKALMNELNGHFQPLVGALKAHGAYVDNYVGDLVMALFNAPVRSGDVEQAATKAVAAAKDFVRLVHERNALRIAAGELPIEVGIGVHCGEAVVGNLGALDTGGNQKIHYTAIGDTVNIASRVESATRGYGVALLVTEEVVRACGGSVAGATSQSGDETAGKATGPTSGRTTYKWEFVAETQVKGRVAPVKLYQVL